jgi:hypothetical protein
VSYYFENVFHNLSGISSNQKQAAIASMRRLDTLAIIILHIPYAGRFIQVKKVLYNNAMRKKGPLPA